ncbi:hypothetical protein CWE09_04225 [Aliidiomarina minuta]|uniref:Sortilin N-terminal domain-containing protein n=1 Tax=Aliidiomarina minuta TaxID=880057 RepID=A0A432W782_9GAMM|nr:hypothetical protein [Aliidiomarina minuta]RUO25940.1 hypothetical protein CWE09_04225 [Aliidiomarina minuta]
MFDTRPLLSILMLISLSGCLGSSTPLQGSSQPPNDSDIVSFTQQGLDGIAVLHLVRQGSAILAGTDNGLYISSDLGASWQHLGLEGGTLLSLVVLSDSHLLTTVAYPNNNNGIRLYESRDSGNNWKTLEHNFAELEMLLYDADNGVLYGGGQAAIARSYNEGVSWELINGETGLAATTSAMALSPVYQEFWHGGQGSIENHYLRRFSLTGDGQDSWNDIFPNPSVIKSIQFHPNEPDHVIISGEGGIGISRDHGTNWQTPFGDVDYAFYWDLIINPDNPDQWFTASWRKNQDTQQLTLEYTKDNGHSWTQVNHPATDQPYGVRSMLLLPERENGRKVLLLGLMGGSHQGAGVMKVTLDLLP